MHLIIYVHDFHPQIGHARAMLELLNGIPPDKKASIQSIQIVSFTCSDLNILFPAYTCPKSFTKVPFPRLKPFLIKMVFYHLFSFIHAFLSNKNTIKISIGLASLSADLINVQFVHTQWNDFFFQSQHLTYLAYFYKKILFFYFKQLEKYVYSAKRNLHYIVIANFLKNYLENTFKAPSQKMALIPSGVNQGEFNFSNMEPQNKIFKNLAQTYPQIQKINPDEPIALFIGALERKGLYRALEILKQYKNAQLIVIGKSEFANFQMPKLPFEIAHIPFTKDVASFYNISDLFIFPTIYEPFGLVILEAYIMGIDLLIPRKNVGASEIIPMTEGIYFLDDSQKLPFLELKKISIEKRTTRRKERLTQIQNYTWEKSGEKFYDLLSEISK